jgi:hypothetical protein
MDPCLPNVSLADARMIARAKLGVPPQYAAKMTVAQVCRGMHMSKKTNIMPPMEYRSYKGRNYLIDPKSPLSISEFVTFLGATSVSELVPVARKLKLVTDYISKKELKTNIIKILQSLNISEPIEIPFKMKIPNSIMNGNSISNLSNTNRSNGNRSNTNGNHSNTNRSNTNGNHSNTNRSNTNGNSSKSGVTIGNPRPSGVNTNSYNDSNGVTIGNPRPSGVNTNSYNDSSNGVTIGKPRPSGVNMSSPNNNSEERINMVGSPRPSGMIGMKNEDDYENYSPSVRIGKPRPSGLIGMKNEDDYQNDSPSVRIGKPRPSGLIGMKNEDDYQNENPGGVRVGKPRPSGMIGMKNEEGNNVRGAAGRMANGMRDLKSQLGNSRTRNVQNVVQNRFGFPMNAQGMLDQARRNLG